MCLEKGHKELLEFYDFPAMHWLSLRTINPIESTFATILNCTRRSTRVFKPKEDAVHDVQVGFVCATQTAQVAEDSGNSGE